MGREKYWRQEALAAQQALSGLGDEGVWRRRANEAVNRMTAAEAKLESAKLALQKIVHTGYAGDQHVDLAQQTLEKIK